MATANLILGLIAIIWGFMVMKGERKWLPILLFVIGAGWLFNALMFTITRY